MNDCLYYYNEDYQADPSQDPQNANVCKNKVFKNINNRNYKHTDFIKFIEENYDSFDIDNPFKFSADYLKLSSEELCNTDKFSLKPQQKFAGQLISPKTNINSALIYHGLGSGKTCTGLVIGQSFANKDYKNILLVVPAALERQYYDEIVGTLRNNELWSCTSQCIMLDKDGSYNRQFYSNVREQKNINQLRKTIQNQEKEIKRIPNTDTAGISKLSRSIELNKRNLTALQKKVESEVSKVFTITTHDKFINSLITVKDNKTVSLNSRLQRGSPLYRDDTVLIIDEIQNLVSESGIKYKILYITLKYYANLNIRKVFLTATPIYDNPYEYALTINLMNPRVPFPSTRKKFDDLFIGKIVENNDGSLVCLPRGSKEKVDYTNACIVNKDLFRYMSSGYVSYFKGGNPNAYPYKRTIELFHEISEESKTSYLEAVKKDLSNEIKRIYRKLKKNLKNANKADADKIEGLLFDPNNQNEASGILPLSRQAINVSISKENISLSQILDIDPDEEQYPEDADGGEKLTELSNLVGTTEIKNNLMNKLSGLSNMDALKRMSELSPKFNKIIKIGESEDRTVFVYSNWVGAGVEAFSTFLDILGYVRFPEKGPKRYFIWSPSIETDQTIINAAKKAFNSPENKDGSILKFMIGTSSIKEGVSFKNVGQVHIIDPWWNNSRIEQITARAIRFCSHIDLEPDERYVDVYRHYSIYPSYFSGTAEPEAERIMEQLELEVSLDDPVAQLAVNIVQNVYAWIKYLTVDQRILEIANRKDMLNNKFLMNIKSASIDAILFREGNIIRLEETIKQISADTYQLFYKNPSTLDVYLRDNQENIISWNDIKNRTYSFPQSKNFSNYFTEAEYNNDLEKLTIIDDADALKITPNDLTNDLTMLENIEPWNNDQKLDQIDITDGNKEYILNKNKAQEQLDNLRKYFLLERADPNFGGIMFSTDDRLKTQLILGCISRILKDTNISKDTKTKLTKILKKVTVPQNIVDKLRTFVEMRGEPESKIQEYLEIYEENPKLIEDILNISIN